MTTNVGKIDRVLRVVIGLGLLSLYFVLDGNARWLSVLGWVPLLTASMGVCPLYSMLGIRTCRS